MSKIPFTKAIKEESTQGCECFIFMFPFYITTEPSVTDAKHLTGIKTNKHLLATAPTPITVLRTQHKLKLKYRI